MSDKAKLSKSERKRLKRSEKRKASGSPETEIVSHSVRSEGSGTEKSCDTNVVRTLTQQDYGGHDNYYTDSERYVQSVLNNYTSPAAMNQNIQYGYPSPTAPPNVFPTTPMASQQPAPPSWALHIIEDLKVLKSSNSKIEQSTKNIELKITAIENKVTALETKVNDIEQTMNFINLEYETQKVDLSSANKEIKQLKTLCKEMETSLKETKDREELTTDKLLDMEARSMRENLIFYGVTETNDTEKCDDLVKSVIQTHLKLDVTSMQLDRAHRLGGNRAKKPRPIVVKFHRYADRETVRIKSRETDVKEHLKGSNLGIGIQSPLQYREARKALYELSQHEKSKGHQTRITGNKLYVNNKAVKKFHNGNVTDL